MAGPKDWPGFSRLRFDTELKTFDSLMSLFLSGAERSKASGKKVMAKSPLTPVDPVYAAGALAYDPYTRETILQAIMKENFSLVGTVADAGLSSDCNPWNLMMLGSILSRKNDIPVDAYSTACGCWDDQIRKSWQLMAEATELPIYFWEIPRFEPELERWAIGLLKKELEQLFRWLAFQTSQKVTESALEDVIRQGNLLRQDLLDITRMLESSTLPMSALEYYTVQFFIGDYLQDPGALHEHYQALLAELEERAKQGVAAPGLKSDKPLRIYLMGDETQQFQLLNTIEDYGGALVGCDCRLPLFYEPIQEGSSALEALARWIWRMPSNLPTAERVKATIPYIKKQKPDAIIISSVVGSRNLPGAERMTRDIIKDELGLPVLSIETTLPREDTEKIDYQIKAFIETKTY